MQNSQKLSRAKKVRHLFNHRSHSVEDLARAFDLSPSTIRRIIDNEISFDPTYSPRPKPKLVDEATRVLIAKREAKSNCQIGQEIARLQNRSRPWSASSVRKLVDSDHFADLGKKCNEA